MSHGSGHPSGYEKSDINVRMVIMWAAIVILFLVIALISVNDWFIKTKDDLYKEMVLEPQNQQLIDLRAHEDSVLTSYGMSDSLPGVYHIPIDSAMKQIAEKTKAEGAK